MDSFNFNSKKKSKWKSTGIFIYSDDFLFIHLKGIEDTKTKLSEFKK